MSRTITLAIITASIVGLYTLGRAQEPNALNPARLPGLMNAGPMNADQLRSEVMSALPGRISRQMKDLGVAGLLPGLDDHRLAEDQSPCQIWGVEVMPVPEIFVDAHESLAAGDGLLLVHVEPGSPASLAGLRRGMVLLSVNDLPLQTESDLPRLDASCRVRVLTKLGVRIAKLPPIIDPLDDILGDAPVTSSSAGGGESVSVSNVNGQVRIDATLQTADGLQSVTLQGTPAEVDRQIDQLPADLASKIRRSVSY